ncbi:hypothetical protein EZV62_010993 [Acer yangbiense]|uniref:ADP/ATP translocase n=1 Tax=Acer yangbiense TaxID=1000413 RepID=A0A5C7I542_9ROSI|nr:hypothetical protein EZV62_010993 [Acer yangbiense]
MADGSQHPSVFQKIQGQSYFVSRISPNLHSRHCSVTGLYVNGLQSSLHSASQGTGLSLMSPISPVSVQAPSEKGVKGFLVDFLMRGVSAAVSKTVVAPIERVKLLIQNQDEMIKSGWLSEPYKGISDCFDRDGYWKWFAGNLALGGAAGASSLRFVYSIDYARTRFANDSKKTLKSDGIAGLYRGFNISCAGIIVYRRLYFGMYDSLKPVVLVGGLQDSFLASFLLGWGITIGAGLALYPIDTVLRRMMMISGEAIKYKSSMDAFSQIVKNEGAKSLFKGAGANILRAVTGAGVLAGYDKLQLVLLGKKYGSSGG